MLKADPYTPEQLAVRLTPGANQAAVQKAIGVAAAPAQGAVGRGVPLVNVLRAILTAVAVVDGLVCLYVLAQSCALMAQERRRTVAILRACGAGPAAVGRVLAGAVAALVIPSALLGILLEALLLGPALSRLAASYATLPLAPSITEIVIVVIGLLVAGAISANWVARRASTESVVQGLAA
jgi:ABC-type antimicrobial peptide transport system permease subunit